MEHNAKDIPLYRQFYGVPIKEIGKLYLFTLLVVRGYYKYILIYVAICFSTCSFIYLTTLSIFHITTMLCASINILTIKFLARSTRQCNISLVGQLT